MLKKMLKDKINQRIKDNGGHVDMLSPADKAIIEVFAEELAKIQKRNYKRDVKDMD